MDCATCCDFYDLPQVNRNPGVGSPGGNTKSEKRSLREAPKFTPRPRGQTASGRRRRSR